VFIFAERLTARLDPPPPAWLAGFAAHVAARFTSGYALRLLRELAGLLQDGTRTPTVLLERARTPGSSIGPLARALEEFFVQAGLALPLDQAERLAKARRQRRIEAVPAPFRPAVAAFTEAQLRARERARRASTRAVTDHTIEKRLAAVRDFACHLVAHRPVVIGWELVTADDVERFLARCDPGQRQSALGALRAFFAWARSRRLILVDPAQALRVPTPRTYRGATVDARQQRRLFRRWTAATEPVHPHEAFLGLMALLHGATCAELRGLRLQDVDRAARTIRLGKRPHPLPLDPVSWAALEASLAYRQRLGAVNPHVIVTQASAARRSLASDAYLRQVLRPAGVSRRLLRSTRLVAMVHTLDPRLVAGAFGLQPKDALRYLGDDVDPARLANP
jgi:integrase